jgi:MinD superfamily P-loop ATPase
MMFPRKPKRTTLSVDKDKCMLCGVCEAVCPKNAISVFQSQVEISKDRCSGCGECVGSCPVEAMKL